MTQSPPIPAMARPPGRGFGIRHLMLAVVGVALLIAMVRYLGLGLLVFLLVLAILLTVVGVAVALIKRRSTQQDGLLAVMAIAARRNMPLAPGLHAFADLCSGAIRRRAYGLAYLLESGVPLPRALSSVPNLLPRQANLLASVGSDQGDLAGGLEQAREAVAARRAHQARFQGKIAYICLVLLVMQNVTLFIFYFITPKFEAIFADFGTTLPAVSRAAILTARTVGWFLPIAALLELVLLVYVGFAVFGLASLDVPLLSRLLVRRDTATILRALTVGVRAGRSIVETLRGVESLYPRRWVRGRLAHARVRIENGEPWTDALVGQGLLGRADAAVLDSAQRAGNLPWALEVSADSCERRLGYRIELFTRLVFPLVIIALGLLVLFISLAHFLPLVQLIQSLA